MSLRLRLVLLTLALVAVVVVTLSALQLRALVNSLANNTISRAAGAGDLTTSFLIDHITRHAAAEVPQPVGDAETRELWTKIVMEDPDIQEFLKKTVGISHFDSILQINILNAEGKALVSYPTQLDTSSPEKFSEWNLQPWYRKTYDLVTSQINWEVIASRPIGIGQQAVFQVQVLTSSLLVRAELVQSVRDLTGFTVVAFLLAMALALLATHSALRPLHRIERTIDRITQGNFRENEAGSSVAKEFQVVENKLNLLGQRMQMLPSPESRQRPLDVLMERVATQLDVARRLTAISRLSGGVAHEIKNPLNAISLRLDLLKVRLDGDEEVIAELEVLSKEVMRLNRVVTTFLDFSRPIEVHFEEVDLGALAREVGNFIRPQAAISNIRVDCITPDEPATMSGDPDLLKQAILNLVTNAVEAMHTTGGLLWIEVAPSENNWILKVRDSGPGIPPELRSKVFQLYFTSKAKGSGIGLAMTYRAAQLHNGTIDFDSESGVGTTFRIEFPATATHA